MLAHSTLAIGNFRRAISICKVTSEGKGKETTIDSSPLDLPWRHFNLSFFSIAFFPTKRRLSFCQEGAKIHLLDQHTVPNAAANALINKLTDLSLFLKFPRPSGSGGPNSRRGNKSASGFSPPGSKYARRFVAGGPDVGGSKFAGPNFSIAPKHWEKP